ncbi:hypothetical protein [Pseudoclavibacter sp. RFBA6]|uniref:hypothetical protein n=1 Tax=Pseudoclavibacter sp. RFBA6 TaxID=2080573 RepID=UPI000CE92517|nr:hypothetical protein [Pseudoclavibacter sp. RFBA6]PPG39465.1 hypothetical protein C5C17_11785 [Pseudoclavibacter sp. RFBA6]
MLLGRPNEGAVYRQRAGERTDGYGETVADDWTNPVEKRLRGASLQTRARSEDDDALGAALSTDRVLHVPGRADLAESDRIRVGTKIYRVDGEVVHYKSLAGQSFTSAAIVRERREDQAR